MRSFILFPILLIFSPYINGQDKIKWNQFDSDELAMTSYDQDTNAIAVVLAHHGKYGISPSYDGLLYQYHKRIKILTARGAEEYGEFRIPYYSRDRMQFVRSIKAQVVSPNGETYLVSKSNMYDEQINPSYSEMTVTFPHLEIGSIIEIKYDIDSKFITYPRPWYFQEEIPTMYSQLEFDLPIEVDYAKIPQGVFESRDDWYFAEHTPGLVREAYVASMNDYKSQLRFQLRNINNRSYIKSWANLAYNLRIETNFGAQYMRPAFVNKAWKAIEDDITSLGSDKEKLAYIYDHVNTHVRWNDNDGIFADVTANQAYADGTGSSTDINFLIIGLARRAGISTAFPALVSYRENGSPNPAYPLLRQFDFVIGVVQIGEELVYIDGGEANRPMGLIREDALSRSAWLVADDWENWIPISPKPSKQTYLFELQLADDGSCQGELSNVITGYTACMHRDHIQQQTQESYWTQLLDERHPGSRIQEYQLLEAEVSKNIVKEKMILHIPSMGNSIGENVYLNMLPFFNIDANVFTLAKRAYPVDIPYGAIDNFIVNIKIPEGMEVVSVPESERVSLPNNAASFRFLCSHDGEYIKLNYSFKINQLYYLPEEYPALKSLFDLVLEKLNEQAVLKRI